MSIGKRGLTPEYRRNKRYLEGLRL